MSAWHQGLERFGTRLLPGARGFLAWWQRSLLAWLPADWQLQLGLSQARLLLWHAQEDDTLRIARQLGERIDPLLQLPWPQAPDDIDRVLGARLASLPHCWLLPGQAALRRPLRLPLAAAERLHDVARFEIDRQTPFQAEQVYYDVRVLERRDDRLDAELVVVPRRTIDALDEQLGAWRSVLSGIDVAPAAGQPLGVNLLPVAQRQQRGDPLRSWNLILLAVAFAALLAAGWQLVDNRRAAAEALRAQVEVGAQRARSVSLQRQQLQDLVEGAAFFEHQRAERPAAVQVWDELTRRLPPGTYLEKLSIEGKQLQLIGLSSEASSLVRRLEGAKLWHTPALTGVLQSDTGTRRDRFTLTAELTSDADNGGRDAAAAR